MTEGTVRALIWILDRPHLLRELITIREAPTPVRAAMLRGRVQHADGLADVDLLAVDWEGILAVLEPGRAKGA